MEPLTPITGKSICTLCGRKISTVEFLAHGHRCKKCDKLPNHKEEKKCVKCPHVRHKEECAAPVARNPKTNENTAFCGCMEVTL